MSKAELEAPALTVAGWLNTSQPLMLEELRGRVVVLHAFQMLCPGCVSHGLPQAAAIHELYRRDEVQVIGLHSVFEHHRAMSPEALKAFVYEYRLQFPIAIDQPAETGPLPVTMQKYHLQGTPSLVLIDKAGNIRLNHFGRISDLQVGNLIGQLLMETPHSLDLAPSSDTKPQSGCDEQGCAL